MYSEAIAEVLSAMAERAFPGSEANVVITRALETITSDVMTPEQFYFAVCKARDDVATHAEGTAELNPLRGVLLYLTALATVQGFISQL